MRSKFPLIISSILILYLLGHMLFGGDTSASLGDLIQERKSLTQQLNQLKAKRHALETRIYALRPATLDVDVIEEIARQRLYMLYEDEIMVVYDSDPNGSNALNAP